MDTTDAETRIAQQLSAYVPRWLLKMLAQRPIEPGFTWTLDSTVLYADLSGFTPLTEALSARGPQGVEALNQILNTVFSTLVETIHAFEGDIIEFSGDALTAFWPQIDRNTLLQAVGAAQAIQVTMQRYNLITTPAGELPLAIRMGIGMGPTTLLVVGTPQQRYFVLSGAALDEATAAKQQAQHNQITLSETVRQTLEKKVTYSDQGALEKMLETIPPRRPQPRALPQINRLTPFVPSILVSRIEQGQTAFITDFRHATVPLFISFAADDPPAVQEYVVAALRIINNHGGHLSEVEIGDKGNVLVALFGAPLSAGDNPERAAACALELASLPATRAIGGAMGPVLSGVIGSPNRHQYTAAGFEVTLSARLMEIAMQAPNHPAIMMSARIANQTRPRFEYGEGRRLSIKGKNEPVPVYRLLNRIENWFTYYPAQKALIGRQQEMAQAQAVMNRVCEGAGQVLLISGEAGIGKSRIATEIFREWITRGGRAYGGEALLTTQGAPYHAWREIILGLLELSADQALEPAALEAAVAALAPDLAPQTPLLAEVLGAPLPNTAFTPAIPPQQQQAAIHGLIAALLKAYAAAYPLLLILEDAQWLDRPSYRLALATAQALTSAPILLCLVHRPLPPTFLESYRQLLKLPHCTMLHISTLTPEETAALVQAHLGGACPPEALLQMVQANAQGHPYFVEEILNTLLDQNLLRKIDADTVVFHAEDQKSRLPDTVQGTIQTRLDSLDEPTRLTLKVASVIGPTFPYTLLQTIHPMTPSDAELQAQLATLVKRQLLTVEASAPELTYAFKSVITQEVTYTTLAFTQRRMLHWAIAEWYEETRFKQTASSDLLPAYALLVHHYHRAGDREREQHYAQLAGEQAATQFANTEALAYLTRALELTSEDNLAQRYELLLAREQIHNLQGDRLAQAADLQTLQTLVKVMGGQWKEAEVTLRLARYAWETCAYQEARQHYNTLLKLAQALGDPALELAAYSGLGNASEATGNYTEASYYLQKEFIVAIAINNHTGMAQALCDLGYVAWNSGAHEEAASYAEQSLEIYEQLNDHWNITDALSLLGLINLQARDHAEAAVYFRQSLELATRIGDRRHIALSLSHLGYQAYLSDDPAQAESRLKEALQLAQAIGFRGLEARCLTQLGILHASLAQPASARAYLYEALCVSLQLDMPQITLYALAGVAWLALDAAQHERAAELLGFILNHPALEDSLRQDTVAPLLDRVSALLPALTLQNALERAKTFILNDQVAKILRETL